MTPLNHRLALNELRTILLDSHPSVLFYDEYSREKAVFAKQLLPDLHLIDTGEQRQSNGHHFEDTQHASPIADHSGCDNDLAIIVYTGGTTGSPKGVMLSHKNVVSNALNTIPYLGLSEETIQLHVGPLFHMGAGQRIFTVTQAAGSHVLLPKFTVEDILQTIEQKNINSIVLVPTMMHRILQHPKRKQFDLSSLRYVSYGAAAMPTALLQTFMEAFPHCLLSQSYGQTECSPVATGLLHRDHLSTGPYGSKLGTVGRAVSTVEIQIRSDNNKTLPPHSVGEVVIRGPNVMKGYWKNPKATADTIRNGWLHTGDMGVLDDDGFLRIVDRIKDMIITGGENVYSAEVENIICQYPGIDSCAIIGLPDSEWGERVHAILRLQSSKPKSSFDPTDLIHFCRKHLAGYKIPRSLEFIDVAFPLTPTNKIDKRLLRTQRISAKPIGSSHE